MSTFVVIYLACGAVVIGWLLIATRTAPELRAPRTDVAHAHPDCAGTWQEQMSTGLIVCDRCAVAVVLTPETSLAASQENDLGIRLLKETRLGVEQRMREKAGW